MKPNYGALRGDPEGVVREGNTRFRVQGLGFGVLYGPSSRGVCKRRAGLFQRRQGVQRHLAQGFRLVSSVAGTMPGSRTSSPTELKSKLLKKGYVGEYYSGY